jgi:hypothetical protein
LNFGQIQLYLLALFFLLVIDPLVSLKQLVFLELLLLGVSVSRSGSLDQHAFDLLVAEPDFFLHDGFDLLGLGLFLHFFEHFLGKGRVFSHHDLHILFLLHLQLSLPLARQELLHPPLDFLVIHGEFLFEFTLTLFFALAFALSLLAELSLLNC